MDIRQQKGVAIATQCKITRKNGAWLVPSQAGKGKYAVALNSGEPTCTCPDHELRGQKCKHIFAVEYLVRQHDHPDGRQTITTTVKITEKVGRPTYPQVWAAYNSAQTNEKDKFQILLHDLCQGVAEPPSQNNGRPRLPLADAIFSAAFKVYSTFSGRRFISDLREAHARGYIRKVPHFNSIFNCLNNADLAPILHRLITEASLPLTAVELDFAVDSSGLTSSRFIRWIDKKKGVVKQHHTWVKFHLMCGVKTNIVTAVIIRGKRAHDSPILPALVNHTAKRFTLREVSGDKGYISVKNLDTIDRLGAVPFIPFKAGQTGARGGLWQKMFHYFSFKREEFLSHYHKRSNAESTFAMIKAKFRDEVRSKTDRAMVNEVLCKVLCHNICCLIQEMYELGIEPEFWKGV